VLDFAHPEDAARLKDSYTCDVKHTSGPAVTELRMKHMDGSWRTVTSRGRNLLSDPTVCAIVVNLTDVTNEKVLAEQLRQSQKLEAVGQLAGGIAHDFNNLLTVIQVHGEFLSTDINSHDPRHADVLEIRAAATRAAGLTHQLLAFSRQQLLQPKVLDVNGVVSSLTPMLRRLIGEDTEIVTIAGEGALRVLADQGQIEQVLMNLVINARDAMREGGSITIESRIVTLDDGYADLHDVVVTGPYVMLSVSDTGVGMDRQTRERIFEPFFTTKEPGRGTGLGLSTVYGIVKQSNGYIWVYSEPDMGTIFKIYLPLAEEALSPAGASIIAPVPSGNETVLLVEDEEAVRVLARKILLRQGYRVLEACNGSDGLATAAAHDGRIDVVVTDVVMPLMNGRGLVERLTAERPGIHVLYLSGYTNDDIVRRGALDHDGRRILQKPFTTAALAQAVRSALDTPDAVMA
jgi:two-component system cell cycle sensor histidine kinase/response regulator CckA